MTQVTLQLDNHRADKWIALTNIFGDENKLIDSFLEFHQKKVKREIARLQLDLNKYEQQYQMSSDDFYQEFKAGKIDDSEDFMLWAGIYEFQLDSKQQLQQLT